jgi:hypothetical protein
MGVKLQPDLERIVGEMDTENQMLKRKLERL